MPLQYVPSTFCLQSIFVLCEYQIKEQLFFILNFRRVLNALLCFLGNPPASELLVPTFRNLLAVRSSWA